MVGLAGKVKKAAVFDTLALLYRLGRIVWPADRSGAGKVGVSLGFNLDRRVG